MASLAGAAPSGSRGGDVAGASRTRGTRHLAGDTRRSQESTPGRMPDPALVVVVSMPVTRKTRVQFPAEELSRHVADSATEGPKLGNVRSPA
jgi:hypothetical protein